MSAMQQMLAGNSAPDTPRIIATSVDFPSFPSTSIRRGGNMTGVVNSPLGSVSCWFRIDGGAGTSRTIVANSSGNVQIYVNTANKIEVFVTGAGGTTQMTCSLALPVGSTWYHLLASWDNTLASGSRPRALLLDGANLGFSGAVTGTGGNISYAVAEWAVGELPGFAVFYDGCLSELWFAPGQYIDFNIAANIRKFRNLAGFPVDLGVDGSLPTGIAPALYLNNEFSTFGINKGTGGDFLTNTGTLTAGSTSP